jgi:hypothetical protein
MKFAIGRYTTFRQTNSYQHFTGSERFLDVGKCLSTRNTCTEGFCLQQDRGENVKSPTFLHVQNKIIHVYIYVISIHIIYKLFTEIKYIYIMFCSRLYL